MSKLSHLFDNNREWSDGIKADNPGFFETSATGQSSRYLWIGCADSRVPARRSDSAQVSFLCIVMLRIG